MDALGIQDHRASQVRRGDLGSRVTWVVWELLVPPALSVAKEERVFPANLDARASAEIEVNQDLPAYEEPRDRKATREEKDQ